MFCTIFYKDGDGFVSQKQVIGCAYCDLLLDYKQAHGLGRYKAVCPRCGSSLYVIKGVTLSLSLSLLVTSYLLVVPAFAAPIFILTAMGDVRMNSIFTGVVELFQQGLWDIALLVLLTAVLFPVVKMTMLLYTLVGINSGRLFSGTGRVFRWYHHLQEWAMVDVFVLGVMVALTKLDTFANVSLGLGFWTLCLMLSLNTFTSFFLNEGLVWQEIERLG